MKAIRYSEYGGPEVLKVVEVDKPLVQSGEALALSIAGLVSGKLVICVS